MSTETTPDPGGVFEAKEFEDVFRAHSKFVYRTAFGVTGSHQDAEDVLQTIFLRLIRRGPADLQRNAKAYLYRAAVNLSLDTLRARRREVLVEGSEMSGLPAPTPNTVKEENHQRLYEAIAGLSPEAAQILILRYVHHNSDAQIARMLGTSRGAIALRLFRSRARLKKILRAQLGGKS
jgi:RNA polymerase sigma-70 factor, ECF subfamily